MDKKVTRSSLALLKMCNGLLRKLSKAQNSVIFHLTIIICVSESVLNKVFCGRILLFLAYAFSLSERSAVNLSGQVNFFNCFSNF